MILNRIILFVLYVLLVAAGTMWRFADAWEGLTFSRRIYFALCASWKWWLLFCGVPLFFDAMVHPRLGLTGDFVVIAIALAMSVAAYFAGKAAGSTPE